MDKRTSDILYDLPYEERMKVFRKIGVLEDALGYLHGAERELKKASMPVDGIAELRAKVKQRIAEIEGKVRDDDDDAQIRRARAKIASSFCVKCGKSLSGKITNGSAVGGEKTFWASCCSMIYTSTVGFGEIDIEADTDPGGLL